MAKYLKKKNKEKISVGKILLLVALAVLLAVLIWVAMIMSQRQIPMLEQNEETVPQTAEAVRESIPVAADPEVIRLSDDLVILEIAGYAGIYMEDGSDEPVADVMMMILENTSSQDIQLARIKADYSDFTAEFEVTNLPAGEKVVALEKNRHPYVDVEPSGIECTNLAFFSEPMALREDKIEIKGSNGLLEVKNISDEDISGIIYVYYKNSASDLLYGGITYRVSVKEGLKAGESAQVMAGHYMPDSCRILQVIWGE